MSDTKRTPYGFQFGSATVSCMCSDQRKGWVIIGIETPKHKEGQGLQVYVTRTGKVRIYSNGEWTPPKKGQR